MNKTRIDLEAAAAHFQNVDPVMTTLLADALNAPEPIAIPQPKPVDEYFASIVASIISQQISTKAADAVRDRVIAHLGGIVTPQTVMQADFDELKSCGLSNQKTRYITHNAQVWTQIPVHEFAAMDNEVVIAELTKLYGIGRWTAEMFLIFSLARSDVFSYGDLGLMKGIYLSYNYKPHYVRKIAATVDNWSPHQSAASLALWFSLDNRPVLL